MSDPEESQLRRLRLAASEGVMTDREKALQEAREHRTSEDMDQRLVDAKIEASEARTDTKFVQLLARLDSIDGKLSRIDADFKRMEGDNQRTRSTVRTTGFTVVSIIVAVLGLLFAVFSQSFNLGSKVSEVAHDQAVTVLSQVRPSPVPTSSPVAIPTSEKNAIR